MRIGTLVIKPYTSVYGLERIGDMRLIVTNGQKRVMADFIIPSYLVRNWGWAFENPRSSVLFPGLIDGDELMFSTVKSYCIKRRELTFKQVKQIRGMLVQAAWDLDVPVSNFVKKG